MFTQCPDCSTAFRVTAEVLKQAAGKVRCGGCGNAFNALDYLSEQRPATPEVTQEQERSAPELTPASPAKEDKLPKSISAEQSAALLKTLDELAGSDIRIEDTGVEWRVVEDDEDDSDIGEVVDTRDSAVDEFLEDSPTPVDQFLTATPNDVDAAEVFEAAANMPGKTPVEELRFDDNTPLPDDFDLDDESSYAPVPADDPETDEEPEPLEEREEPQADLDLSEPDEWEDILDEFEDLRGDSGPAPLEAELAALENAEDETSTEPESSEMADEPGSTSAHGELLDMDTQFALQAEAMGIDLTGTQKGIEAGIEDEPQAEIEDEPEAGIEDEPEAEIEDEPEAEIEGEPEAGIDDDADDAARLDLIDEQDEAEAPLEFGAVEKELAKLGDQSDVFDSSFFVAADEVAAEIEEASLELDGLADDTADEGAQAVEATGDGADATELVDELELDLEEHIDLEAQPDLKEELQLSAEPYPEDELDLGEPRREEADLKEHATTESPADSSDSGETVVPPLSEEEQTINMMIDQDLMSLAVEDEDGFASTIIIPEEDGEETGGKKDRKKRRSGKKDKKDKKKKKGKKKDIKTVSPFDEAQGFETIIMEGEHVRSSGDEEKLEADAAAARELVAAAKAEEAAQEAVTSNQRLRMIGAAAALLLVLVVQVLHQSREALATNPLFNDIVGPVYRAIGKPLLPAWDITGWRIEATKGSIEENEETLVVYSRIGNKSDKPLPYPIINISLTDRFEETLGSQQLDPGEYLPDNLDPGKLVQPGKNFNAVISIQSPSDDASGYELDVCYRVSAGQLRCAIADFK